MIMFSLSSTKNTPKYTVEYTVCLENTRNGVKTSISNKATVYGGSYEQCRNFAKVRYLEAALEGLDLAPDYDREIRLENHHGFEYLLEEITIMTCDSSDYKKFHCYEYYTIRKD